MTKHSFYVPHDRVQEDGAIVNHVTGEVTYPPSMTKQEFVAECDINNIIKAFTQTGQLTHISSAAAKGMFEDLPEPLELQDALNVAAQAEAAFMALPAKVRDRFHNEPIEFMEFMSDPANKEEAGKLGLLKPVAPAAEPLKVEVVNPAAPAVPPNA